MVTSPETKVGRINSVRDLQVQGSQRGVAGIVAEGVAGLGPTSEVDDRSRDGEGSCDSIGVLGGRQRKGDWLGVRAVGQTEHTANAVLQALDVERVCGRVKHVAADESASENQVARTGVRPPPP